MILDQNRLEQELSQLGKEIFDEVAGASISVFDAEFYVGKLMDWSMRDEEFKVNLFRFVDVFPTLVTSAAIVRHAQEYFDSVSERIPGVIRWGLKVNPEGFSAKMGAKLISRQMRQMATRFIVGEDGRAALKTLKEIRRGRSAFTVDLLGEATVNEAESLEYQSRYFELIETLGSEVPGWREARPIVEGHQGEVTPVQISVKLSALYSQIRSVAHDRSVTVLRERFSEILRRAKQRGIAVIIDMEDSSMTSITLDLFKQVLSDPEFRDYDRCGVVLQAYMRRTEADLEEILKWVRARGVPVQIRLVKGAYWDTETLYSRQKGWPNPLWETKSSTDACYERLTLRLLENHEFVFPAFGSHNVRSLAFAVKAAELLGVSRTQFELQVLYGMAEPLRKAFTDRGYLMRQYSPVGDLLLGMSYLVRRLLENTSNEGFLRQGFYELAEPAKLLVKPQADPEDTGAKHLEFNPRVEFRNIPNADFSLEFERAELAKQIEQLRGKLRAKPAVVKPYISGRYLETTESLESVSPDEPSQKLGTVYLASAAQAKEAVAGLAAYFPLWRGTALQERGRGSVQGSGTDATAEA